MSGGRQKLQGDRLSGKGVGLLPGQLFAPDHPVEHHLHPLDGQVRAAVGRVGRWSIGQARQHHGFGVGELQRRFAKVALRGFADAVVPAAEIDGVDVHFKDLFLVVLLLNGEGGEHLRRLAGQMLFLREQGVLGQLLGDGAAALGKAAGAQVGHQCPGNGHRVHTLVVGEAGILCRDHGVDVGLGQLGIGNEPFAGRNAAVQGIKGGDLDGALIEFVACDGKVPARCHEDQQGKQQHREQQLPEKTKNGMHGVLLSGRWPE